MVSHTYSLPTPHLLPILVGPIDQIKHTTKDNPFDCFYIDIIIYGSAYDHHQLGHIYIYVYTHIYISMWDGSNFAPIAASLGWLKFRTDSLAQASHR